MQTVMQKAIWITVWITFWITVWNLPFAFGFQKSWNPEVQNSHAVRDFFQKVRMLPVNFTCRHPLTFDTVLPP